MKPGVTSAMIDLILTQQRFVVAELYTVQLLDGTIDRYNDIDADLTIAGLAYKGTSLRFEGLKYKLAVGWQVDEQTIKISANPNDDLAGANFFPAIEAGLLDGAYITRARAFWSADQLIASQIYLEPPVGVFTLFTGRVSTINKIGRTHVEMKLKSPMSWLDIDMPRNSFAPACSFVLFDQGCTLNKASFTFSGVVNTVDTTFNGGFSVVGGIPTPVSADSIARFKSGRLLFTSGVNNNLQVSLRDNDTTAFYYTFPPITGVVPGDTFNAWPGCSKTANTCAVKFSNIEHFRGFPFVPPVVISA